MTKNYKANIQSYKDRNGNTLYMFRIYTGINEKTGKPENTTRRGFTTKKAAETEYITIKAEVAKGTYKKKRRETFADIYELWLEEKYIPYVEESTLAKTLGYFRNHILPSLGHRPIGKISSTECKNYYNEWTKKLSKAKVIKSYASSVLDYAGELGLIQSNPFHDVKTQIKKQYSTMDVEKVEKYYSKEELLEFLSYCKESLPLKAYALIKLLAFSGMRKSEALALTWKDLDFKDGELTINKAIGRGLKGKLYLKSTKTNKPRKIIIDSETLVILREWKKLQKSDYLKLGFNTLVPEQLIFTNKYNNFIQTNQVEKWMYSVQKKYNLKKVTPHGLRHSHCTHLIEAEVHVKEIQELLGHNDIKTTLNIYAHISKQTKIKANKKLLKYYNK